MLEELTVRNLALSALSEVSFKAGLNCVTGETGAGKSLIVDALSLILGARAETGLIRSGEEKAEVSAWFSLAEESPVNAYLKELDLTGDEDGTLLIRRTLSADGKSRSFVNGHSCTLTVLRNLALNLVSIHGQHASVQLMDEGQQLNLLDAFGGLSEQVSAVKGAFEAYAKARHSLTELSEEQKQGALEYRQLRHELEILKALNLEEGGYEILEKSFDEASHLEETRTRAEAVLASLTDEENGLIESLNTSLSSLEKVRAYAPSLPSVIERLTGAKALLEEGRDLLGALNAVGEGESAASLSEKLSRCHELSRRFNVPPSELYLKTAEVESRLTRFLSLKERIGELTGEVKALREAYAVAEAELQAAREEAAIAMSGKVTSLMHSLAMPDGRFEVRVTLDTESRPRARGRTRVAFYFTANLGEELKTLGEAASGGELSRLALAIETLTSRRNLTPTVVFDEVDTGISGRTASAVGTLLQQIGKNAQVLCVTHLPQVAARADAHFLVQKETAAGKVTSRVTLLDAEERVQEVARMMGGEVITDNTLTSARELIAASKESAGELNL